MKKELENPTTTTTTNITEGNALDACDTDPWEELLISLADQCEDDPDHFLATWANVSLRRDRHDLIREAVLSYFDYEMNEVGYDDESCERIFDDFLLALPRHYLSHDCKGNAIYVPYDDPLQCLFDRLVDKVAEEIRLKTEEMEDTFGVELPIDVRDRTEEALQAEVDRSGLYTFILRSWRGRLAAAIGYIMKDIGGQESGLRYEI